MRKIVVMLLISCVAMPVLGQKSKSFLKAADAALNRKIAADFFAKQKTIYDPVFGYMVPVPPMPPHPAGALTAFTGHTQNIYPGNHLMQVAPLKRPLTGTLPQATFVRGDLMTPGQLAQAAYLWQLAHPWQSLEKYPYLWQKANDAVASFTEKASPYEVEYLPNLKLLKRMLDPGFKALSFAKLVELTPVYPTHITLDEEGFPVPTPQADLADMLDTYLMLSNPREMSAFVNAGEIPHYRPFVLTREERTAANQLLARRLDSDKLPANATARDLIAQTYNRLETHTLKYTQVDAKTPLDFKVYPHYKNTRLYRAIQGIVIGQWPVVWIQDGHHVLQNRDAVHLIVLDAVMGGVDWHNYNDVSRVMESFRELCTNTTPTPQHIAHLELLQKNLYLVFRPLLLEYIDISKNPYGLHPEETPLRHIGSVVWDMLVKQNIRSITGKHL